MTTGSSPVASSAASLMSDSTQSAWVWAISIAPASRRRRWRTRARRSGARPTRRGRCQPGPREVEERHRRQHDARTRSSARSVARSAPARAASRARRRGPRRARRRGDDGLDDRRVDVLEAVGRLVEVIERRGVGHEVGARVPGRAEVTVGMRAMASSVSTVTCSWPPGPSPTTTTVGRSPAGPGRRVTGRRRPVGAGPSARSGDRPRCRPSAR